MGVGVELFDVKIVDWKHQMVHAFFYVISYDLVNDMDDVFLAPLFYGSVFHGSDHDDFQLSSVSAMRCHCQFIRWTDVLSQGVDG